MREFIDTICPPQDCRYCDGNGEIGIMPHIEGYQVFASRKDVAEWLREDGLDVVMIHRVAGEIVEEAKNRTSNPRVANLSDKPFALFALGMQRDIESNDGMMSLPLCQNAKSYAIDEILLDNELLQSYYSLQDRAVAENKITTKEDIAPLMTRALIKFVYRRGVEIMDDDRMRRQAYTPN